MGFNKTKILVCVIVLFLSVFLTGEFLISLGLSLNIYFFLDYLDKLGKDIPLFELIILLALSQWVLGPYIDYITPVTDFRYYMYVDEETYYSFVIPAIIIFMLPLIIFKKDIDLLSYSNKIRNVTENNPKLPWILVIAGLLSGVASRFLPASLGFFFFILAQFKFIGLIYMFFSRSRYNTHILYLLFGATLLSSIQEGLFHDLILWGALFFTFIVYKYQWSFAKTLIIALTGIFFMLITQSIKANYRLAIDENPGAAGIETFSTMAINQVTGEGILSSEQQINDLNVRLNQGWIISAIMANIPDYQSFFGGETIENAISASLVPRILNPSKAEAGGRENFMKFTGMEIREHTSMGISVLGEAYGNYGRMGAFVFMGIWGAFLVIFYNGIIRISKKLPSIILWIPIIFLQVLKAETEFLVVFNHLIKASIVVFLFFWIGTKTMKWKL